MTKVPLSSLSIVTNVPGILSRLAVPFHRCCSSTQRKRRWKNNRRLDAEWVLITLPITESDSAALQMFCHKLVDFSNFFLSEGEQSPWEGAWCIRDQFYGMVPYGMLWEMLGFLFTKHLCMVFVFIWNSLDGFLWFWVECDTTGKVLVFLDFPWTFCVCGVKIAFFASGVQAMIILGCIPANQGKLRITLCSPKSVRKNFIVWVTDPVCTSKSM